MARLRLDIADTYGTAVGSLGHLARQVEAAALAAAAELEEAFPRERLDELVKTGGWDPSRPEPDGGNGAAAPAEGDPA